MIAELHAHPDGRLIARTLFGRPARDLALSAPPAPAGAIVRVDPGAATATLLAPPGSALAAVYRLLGRFDLDPDPSPAALAEARAHLAAPGLDDPDLADLEHLEFITIDNEGSRDLDQALHIAPGPEGGFTVRYALADASYYVRPGSALFAAALARGTSFYLPGLSVPMLPRELSEGLVSLNPGVPRRALVFEMALDAHGHPVATRLVRARVRSRRQLTYDGVQAYYDAPAASPLAGTSFSPTLDLLRAVGERRIALAEAEDVVQYNRVNLSVGLADPAGLRFVALGDARNACERYNEQVSLLCNAEGARLLAAQARTDASVLPVFRVHPAPAEAALDDLAAILEALIAAHGLDPARWRWRRGAPGAAAEPLASFVARLPAGGPDRPLFLAVQRQALLSNQRSRLQAEPGLHFGVGAPCYSRFSAPMREVVGIFTHKEALEALSGAPGGPDDAALREAVMASAERAKDRQRELTQAANLLAIDALLGPDLALPAGERPWRPAAILGQQRGRLYLLLDAPPFELKLDLAELAAALGVEAAATSPVEVRLARGPREARLRVGDRVNVRVEAYDPIRQRYLLVPEPALALVA